MQDLTGAGGTRGRPVPAGWTSGPPVGLPDATVVELILGQARERPGVVAVRQWEDRLTYAELVAAAGRVAAVLRQAGVGPEVRVGLCWQRRPSLLVALLGILMAGGAYVPLDPSQPGRRLVETADDAGLGCIVADEAGCAVFAGTAHLLVALPAGPGPAQPVGCPALPGNACYVMYTSGSTGRPKGVVVTHRNVVAFTANIRERSGIGPHCRTLAITSIAFDVSVLDLLVALAVGASVQLAAESDRSDPARLQRFIEEHEVNWVELPPALLPLLSPGRLAAVRTVVTGAEAPGPEQVARWSAGGRLLMNGYGPTETTVAVTGFHAAGEWNTPVPIGRPMVNHRVHVVDEDLRPVPVEVPGELLVGGPGLTRGYLDQPGLTAERFIPDPFGAEPGARLYRTGDLVSWGADGQLRFHGRVDRQVKVRGQRVELGEIEAVLRTHPGVSHAVVTALPGAGEVALAAFVTPAGAPGDAELGGYLAERLPPAMVPGRIIRLAELPLNTSDKVDLDALVALLPDRRGGGNRQVPGVPPELTAIWCEVLGVEAPGGEDDFFARGGHSLAAMRLVAAVRQSLRRDVAVEDVFAGRTLRGLAERVGAAPPVSGVDVPTGNPPALSAAQRRLWFLDQLAPDAAAYNIALAQRLRGPLDVAALAAALTAVADRHEVLRWRVPHTLGRPYVVIGPPAEVPLPVEDLRGAADPARALRERLHAEAARRFDLAGGGLWRARLLRLAAQEHVLAITAHHAVFDGWSERVLYTEIARAYAGSAAAPLPATFADYVAWRADRETRNRDRDLAWWTGHLAGAPTVLDLPRDRQRPVEQSYAGAFAGAGLSAGTDAAVRALARELSATPSTIVLAAFGELLCRVAGRRDLVIGAPVADRRHAAFQELIGFFVDIVPLRLGTPADRTFADHVLAVREELLDVLAHPSAPLEDVVDALALRRDPSRGALVQVLFNVYNFAQSCLELPGIEAAQVPAGLPGAPFDLTTYLVERDGRFRFELVYNPDLYSAGRIDALLAALVHLLGTLVAAPHEPVSAARLPNLPALRAGLTGGEPLPGARSPLNGGELNGGEPAGGELPGGELAGGEPVRAGPGAPRPTERIISEVWCVVLGRPRVSLTDSFFDLGGKSLDLVTVAQRLAVPLGRELRVVDLFRYPSVRALAAFVDGTGGGGGLQQATQRGAARREHARRRTGRHNGPTAPGGRP